MSVQITVPTLGESVTEATVAKWLKKVGDTVAVDEPIVELETDKASLEVSAPSAGVLSEILVADGADVAVGAVLGSVDENGAAAAAPAPASVESAPAPQAAPTPGAPAAGNGEGTMVEVVVPEVGESVTEGTVAKWLKNVGDPIAIDDPLVELETDKATLEVPSTAAGTLAEIRVNEGDDVAVGSVLAVIAGGAAAAATAQRAAAPAPAAPAPAAPAPTAPASPASATLSPAVRKLIDDNNLDPAAIPATGAKGQLTKGDVLAFLRTGGAAAPQPAARPAPSAPPAQAPGMVPASELPARAEDPSFPRCRAVPRPASSAGRKSVRIAGVVE